MYDRVLREADEIVVLDIGATASAKGPNAESIEAMVSEAFMPVSYGGGVASVETALQLIRLGVDKIRETGRSAQGVTLIKCGEDDLVTSASLLAADDEDADE